MIRSRAEFPSSDRHEVYCARTGRVFARRLSAHEARRLATRWNESPALLPSPLLLTVYYPPTTMEVDPCFA